MSKRGKRWVFTNRGGHVATVDADWMPGRSTFGRVLHVNTKADGDKIVIIEIFSPASGQWEEFDRFSEKAGDSDYNLGDVTLSFGWDGSLLVEATAGDGSGGNVIMEGAVYYSPQETGFPAAPGVTVVTYEAIDRAAREQAAAQYQATQNAVLKANAAADKASQMQRMVKDEVKSQLKNALTGITLNTATILKAVSDDIALGLRKDAKGNRQGVLIHALWQVIESASKDMLWSMGIRGAK